ncbi:MAG: hypothetical protein J0665_21195 [Deltaproteobacteria bacterium]|nr:hypothetical protein [Deltaproteobacteria bacterium]
MEHISTWGKNVNSRFTFDNFLGLKGNSAALQAARLLAEGNNTSALCPLVIVSQLGMGKTHLLCAIANQVVKMQPNAKCMLTDGERFSYNLKQSCQKGLLDEYSTFLCSSDYFLFDTLDFIAGKSLEERELLRLIDTLTARSIRCVFTLYTPPSQVGNLIPRLKEWLESGRIVTIDENILSDVNDRTKTIRFIAKKHQIQLAVGEIEIIANAGVFSFRVLEGILIRIQAYLKLKCATVPIEEMIRKCSS